MYAATAGPHLQFRSDLWKTKFDTTRRCWILDQFFKRNKFKRQNKLFSIVLRCTTSKEISLKTTQTQILFTSRFYYNYRGKWLFSNSMVLTVRKYSLRQSFSTFTSTRQTSSTDIDNYSYIINNFLKRRSILLSHIMSHATLLSLV